MRILFVVYFIFLLYISNLVSMEKPDIEQAISQEISEQEQIANRLLEKFNISDGTFQPIVKENIEILSENEPEKYDTLKQLLLPKNKIKKNQILAIKTIGGSIVVDSLKNYVDETNKKIQVNKWWANVSFGTTVVEIVVTVGTLAAVLSGVLTNC